MGVIYCLSKHFKTEDETGIEHLLLCVGVLPKRLSFWSLFEKHES